MIDVKSPLKALTDRAQWTERTGSFVTKLKATKAVWFPPEPVKTGRSAASAGKKTAKKATKKATTKSTAAAKKSASSAKKVTSPMSKKAT